MNSVILSVLAGTVVAYSLHVVTFVTLPVLLRGRASY